MIFFQKVKNLSKIVKKLFTILKKVDTVGNIVLLLRACRACVHKSQSTKSSKRLAERKKGDVNRSFVQTHTETCSSRGGARVNVRTSRYTYANR